MKGNDCLFLKPRCQGASLRSPRSRLVVVSLGDDSDETALARVADLSHCNSSQGARGVNLCWRLLDDLPTKRCESGALAKAKLNPPSRQTFILCSCNWVAGTHPMLRFLLLHFGHRIASESGVGRVLDWKLGLRLLRERRVAPSTKLLSLGLGIGALAALQVLELPIESALALLVPVLGLAGDLALEGVEIFAVPFFVATLALPHLAPRELVEEVRATMHPQPVAATIPTPSGLDSGHLYDAPSSTIR